MKLFLYSQAINSNIHWDVWSLWCHVHARMCNFVSFNFELNSARVLVCFAIFILHTVKFSKNAISVSVILAFSSTTNEWKTKKTTTIRLSNFMRMILHLACSLFLFKRIDMHTRSWKRILLSQMIILKIFLCIQKKDFCDWVFWWRTLFNGKMIDSGTKTLRNFLP